MSGLSSSSSLLFLACLGCLFAFCPAAEALNPSLPSLRELTAHCPAPPPFPKSNATSIHNLHPRDISVVMAMGDSITAGFGIKGYNGFSTLDEYRGLSHSIGGDEGAVTLPGLLRLYNPSLIGASLGSHLVELPGWDYYEQDKLNAAQSNAGIGNLLFQLDYLYKQLASNPKVDMQNDWKLLNLLVGANDICGVCLNIELPTIEHLADYYEHQLAELLKQAHARIPRLFFNILPMFNISQVYWLGLNRTYCDAFHVVNPFECLCIFDTDQARRDYLDQTIQAYNQRIYKLYDQWKSYNLQDFTFQVQPFSANLVIPSLEYLSTLDCFHPSLLAHQQLAIANWNSLLTPWANKPSTFHPGEPIICPDENSKLWTS